MEYAAKMDWELAIERNRSDLLRLLRGLFALAGLVPGDRVDRLPRRIRSAILLILRGTESATRRLAFVLVAVRGIKAPLVKEQPMTSVPAKAKSKPRPQNRQAQATSFRLIDPRKNFETRRPKRAKGPGPRITVFGSDDPIFDRSDLYAYQNRPAPTPEDQLSAERLCARLNAVFDALEDLPKQALRMVKLEARLQRRFERHGGVPPKRVLRPSYPPGYRLRHIHEIDDVLHECHQIALMAAQIPPDTS